MPKCLPSKVKLCLNKAIDSALLAVETYNKPAVKFKSGGYIVLMCIAWTSLFHAIFLRRQIKPLYKDGRRYKKIEGDYAFWELNTCVKKYFEDENSAIRKNIEFFIPLRNKIEHRFMPDLDANIFGECQSLLMNFDKIIEKEFSAIYCIRESLSFALQLYPKLIHIQKEHNIQDIKIYDWIKEYRSSIGTDILKSGEYSFKAFLVQVANHDSQDALPIQFYPYDKLTEDEKHTVDRVVALIKKQTILQNVVNKDLMKPSEVVIKVQSGLGNPKINRGNKSVDKFNMDTFTRCWKKYNIRPEQHSDHPERTLSQYCIYDLMNKNYGYTQDCVDFLIREMQIEGNYESLFKHNA